MKTPWTLVKLSVALEADYYFCHHPHKMECKGRGQRQVKGDSGTFCKIFNNSDKEK